MRLSRRRLLATLPASALALVLAACGGPPRDEDSPVGLREEGRLWEIPEAAWSHPLGSHPPGATGAMPSYGSVAGAGSRTQRGVPVGGIGTGAFMLNLSGTFGPWHMDVGGDDSIGSRWGSDLNSGLEYRFLSQAAFHLRVTTPQGIVVQTLATEDVLPAWPRLQVGQGVYSALFPRAWFEYEGLPVDAALKQVTPFVARDERRSSLPAGLFQLAVSNSSGEHVLVDCMFSFPNAPYRLPTAQYDYTRTGLRSQAVRAGDAVGVRLQAQSPHNTSVTDMTEWVIAAAGPKGARVSWTEDWAADGDGSDLMAVFAQGGILPDAPIDERGLGLAGAVSVSFSLAPGARKAATFVLSWDFPVVQFRDPVDGTRWWKRYTEYYSGPYRGWSVAKDVLAGATALERGVDAWWKPIAEDATYPVWLRRAALNELYYDVFGGVFWENGCITKPKRYGRRPGQHLYFTLEDDAFRDCESFDVRHYETRHLLQLFPTIEHDVLLGWADFIEADPLGRTPHDAGSPVNDPWFVPGQYAATRPHEAPLQVDWLDLPAKFVQQAHAYWHYTGDDRFGADVYPAARKTLEHLLSLDLDGDGIPDATGFCTTYDALAMHGAAIYVAALTIGACEAMSDLAARFGSVDDQTRFSAAADAARASAETLLWVEDPGYYKLDTTGRLSAGLLADALCGQRFAAASGLPDVLRSDRMGRHLALVHARNLVAVAGGRYGVVNLTHGDPAVDVGLQGRAVWPGGSYFVGATMLQVGGDTHRADLVNGAFDCGYGVYRTTYEDDASAFWFDTPALWLPETPLRYRAAAYQRSRAAWELLVAVKDPFPPGWAPA